MLDHARLYDLPEERIPIIVGVSGPASVALAAANADGIMTTEPSSELVEGFRSQSGKQGPCYVETLLAYAGAKQEGLETAHRHFRFSPLGWPANTELPSVEAFEKATRFVRPEDLIQSIAVGPDAEDHVETVRKAVEAGFDHIVLTCPGPGQAEFIEFFQSELKPRLQAL
jgi:G6PDH family F420-dependent oxidoreductase